MKNRMYQAMKEAIMELKCDPDRRNMLSKGSLEKGKELSLDDKAARLIQYFTQKQAAV